MTLLAPLKKLHRLAFPRGMLPSPTKASPMGYYYRYRVIMETPVFGKEELMDDRADEAWKKGDEYACSVFSATTYLHLHSCSGSMPGSTS
jgi:hypothetical protein